ncbi:MAG: nucleoside phosphorylase [Acidimicrobiales bacterium]
MDPSLVALTEFDADRRAVLEPRTYFAKVSIPERVVGCFFHDVIAAVSVGLEPAYRIPVEHGAHPIWVIERDGVEVAVFNPGVGAPLAACCLEAVIGLGGAKIVVCGGAGQLVPGFAVGHVVVPTSALRDEGTSFHYLEPGRYVEPSSVAVAAIVAELETKGVPHEQGRTWTTDGLFRETRGKVERRVQEGCLTVEMEAAALFAVAAFRGITLGQMLYCGDDMSAPEWDYRDWDTQGSVRASLFELALGAVLRL